ncbi:MAG: hypothetical protein NXY59_01880 [Aigarchaeota archaeon]|nr:hypothetical protein [Candidatus Pelearchaeum maunauluense]
MAQKAEDRIIIHLINYDYGYDSARDRINPHPSFWLSLKLPELYRVSDVYLMTPDDNSSPTPLQYEIRNNRINITLPYVGVWSMIVIEPVSRVETITETRFLTFMDILERTVTKVNVETETTTIASTYARTLTIREEQPAPYPASTTTLLIAVVAALGLAVGYMLRGRGQGHNLRNSQP